ncbi:hypothetical protein WN51_09911 [Melipona quadrifasciata]|uniref:Uncharacterized protein n=1 Tax=Melipona quadrifasciata TaxID=166423 RepID=A0A0N1IU10_9HYME|nr:hypothetical protein WN51_09911 [Melipona quadrifasciata]
METYEEKLRAKSESPMERGRMLTFVLFFQFAVCEIGLGEILRTKQNEVVTDWFEGSLFNSELKLEESLKERELVRNDRGKREGRKKKQERSERNNYGSVDYEKKSDETYGVAASAASGRERQLKLFNFTISFRMRELCRFDSFLCDVYFPRNSNLTLKGNIPADGVLLSRIPAGKKSKVVTIDLGNSLFTELTESRNQGRKRENTTEEGRRKKKEMHDEGIGDLIPTILLINNYRRISRQ